MLWPWNDAPLDRFVVLLPGDASLDWGASTTVSARLTQRGAAAGVRPADLVLETRGGDGVWRVSAWDRVDAEAASFETGPLSGALDYRARRRDQATSARRLTPVAAPRFKAARAVDDGARGPKTFVLGEDAPVRARRGDWITVSGEPEAELASAALRLSSLQAPLPMRAGSGGSWSAGFPAQEDATLSFALVSADGRRDAAPPAYALAVLGDAKPAAELLSPQVPLQAGPREVIPIAYAARDDGALTKLELATRAQGKESRRALPLERGASEALGDAHLALKDYRPGVEVEFWIEAWDDASPPQGARSERGTVEIVDVDAAHAESLKARDAALAALDKAAEAAEAAAKAARSGDENAAREAARPVAGRMAAASGALMRWTQALAEDPRANPGLAEQADAAAQSLAEAAMEGLPKAESALAEKNLAAAAREQSALAEQARSAASALKEGSAVQNAQDMADRARGAERESADIERSLSALQSASPAELAELSKALAGVQEALEDLRKAVDALPEADPETSKVRDLPLDSARESAQKLQNALRSGDAAAAAKAARELAEKLSRVSKGLRESGMRSAQSRADKAKQGAGKVAQAWREAVAAQERAVESARRREAERQAGMLKEQKALVRRAQDEIESALSSSPPPEAERAARAAKQSLAQGRADDAARQLRQAAGACAAASAPARTRRCRAPSSPPRNRSSAACRRPRTIPPPRARRRTRRPPRRRRPRACAARSPRPRARSASCPAGRCGAWTARSASRSPAKARCAAATPPRASSARRPRSRSCRTARRARRAPKARPAAWARAWRCPSRCPAARCAAPGAARPARASAACACPRPTSTALRRSCARSSSARSARAAPPRTTPRSRSTSAA